VVFVLVLDVFRGVFVVECGEAILNTLVCTESMSDFITACKTSDVPPGGKLSLEVADRFIVIANIDGAYFCIDDVCTHDGGTLGDGEIDGHCLVCPRHGAKFDVRNGDAITMPATEATASHEVRIEGDQIFVRLH
jgi:3-phenylpropionate/trans-cinnamate dioxygenase ferredoxin component